MGWEPKTRTYPALSVSAPQWATGARVTTATLFCQRHTREQPWAVQVFLQRIHPSRILPHRALPHLIKGSNLISYGQSMPNKPNKDQVMTNLIQSLAHLNLHGVCKTMRLKFSTCPRRVPKHWRCTVSTSNRPIISAVTA